MDYQFVRVWDANTGAVVCSAATEDEMREDLAFSPDGRTLAVASLYGVQLLDAATGTHSGLLARRTPFPVVCDIAVSSAGWLAACLSGMGSGKDSQVELWDLATGQARHVLPISRGAHTRAWFSRDGHRLVTSTDGQIQVWDVPGLP